MAAGDPTAWAGRFRSFDERFLERVVAVWPRCLAILPPQPDEDTITVNLVNLLQRDPDTRSRFHWIEFQYEPFGYTPEGTAYSKGRVDMAVILDQELCGVTYFCRSTSTILAGSDGCSFDDAPFGGRGCGF